MAQLIKFKGKFIRICPEDPTHLLQSEDRGKSWQFLYDGSMSMNSIMDIASDENLILLSCNRGYFISNNGEVWTKVMDFEQLKNQPMKLYLDDVRPTPENFQRVYNFDEFVKFIADKGLPNFISFDHDLGEEKTGYDCAKFLVDYCLDQNLKLPEFYVHSQNPVGKENIEKLLDNFNKFKDNFR